MVRSSNKSPKKSSWNNMITTNRYNTAKSQNDIPSSFRGIRKFKIGNVNDHNAVATVITQTLSLRNPYSLSNKKKIPISLRNESLLSLRVSHLEMRGVLDVLRNHQHPTFNNHNIKENLDGTRTMTLPSSTTNSSKGTLFHPWKKVHNKDISYICITRSTNQPLFRKQLYHDNVFVAYGQKNEDYKEFQLGDEQYYYSDSNGRFMNHSDDVISTTSGEEEEDDDDMGRNDDYSLLYNPEDVNHHPSLPSSEIQRGKGTTTTTATNTSTTKSTSRYIDADPTLQTPDRSSKKEPFPDHSKDATHTAVLDEISSFPQLVCFNIHADGTNPRITHVLDLEKLVSIDHDTNRHPTRVQLLFQNGVTLDIDLGTEDEEDEEGPDPILMKHNNTSLGVPSMGTLKTSKFLWSLLQIHAILCTSAIERNATLIHSNTGSTLGGNALVTQRYLHALPPLTMRNVDRAELQYLSTLHGFLSENPSLRALLERQRHFLSHSKMVKTTTTTGSDHRWKSRGLISNEEKSSSLDEMDGIAYDMIMGNFTNTTIFFSEDEKKDAEDVLNSIIRQTRNFTDDNHVDSEGQLDLDDADTSEKLTELLRNKMRMLEAETCYRLIAWEDQKLKSTNPASPVKIDTTESLGLANLFETLDNLERDLENMEDWLVDKAEAIRPLMNDCREVAEENRQIEQQKYSYELLSIELERLLDGLEIDGDTEVILLNPNSRMVYFSDGSIDLRKSEAGVKDIHRAGKALKQAFDKVHQDGGIHLRAVLERVESLIQVSNSFCAAVANIVIDVMKETLKAVSKHDSELDSNRSSHQAVARSLRNIQKESQTTLLAYIQLIEVLALLKPTILDSIRDEYSELVADSIFSRSRMNIYFMSLPGKGMDITPNLVDLSMYPPVPLKATPQIESNHPLMKPVQSQDIQRALADMLPLIAREAYFTAALFALSAKHLSGREKKRNFESAKNSVDHSTRHFRYYISRLCGIASDVDADGQNITADPMLSLVSSILLNEAMDSYIDRQRKGGDHSLSLAYVRATILELRKKVDKQWVGWIEDQIKWIRSNPGVPISGKRAGIFSSFSRFPSYLDHIMVCCKIGRPDDFTVNLSNIKVAAYYLQKLSAALFSSLHDCTERETTDKQYAANVMRMENSYFFIQCLKQRDPDLCALFQKQITAASSICKQSTDSYLGFMIKREFKSLHSLFSNISNMRREVGDANVSIHIPFSTFEKSLAKECNREILKEKVAAIYLRMEKHLAEEGGLLPVAWKALVKVLFEWFGRWEKLCSQIYSYKLQPSSSDVVRIAKQVAGTGVKKNKDERQSVIPLSRRDNF